MKKTDVKIGGEYFAKVTKVEEHWDFFWRAKIAGMHVAVDVNHSFKHEHVDPPGYVRRRPEFLDAGLQKHGLRKVVWR